MLCTRPLRVEVDDDFTAGTIPSSPRNDRADGRRSIASPISSFELRCGTNAGANADALREEFRVCAATVGLLGKVSGVVSCSLGRSGVRTNNGENSSAVGCCS